MRYPWIAIALAFIGGICASAILLQSVWFNVLLAGLAGSAGMLFTVLRQRSFAYCALVIAFFFCGAAAGALKQAEPGPGSLTWYFSSGLLPEDTVLELTGRIDDLTETRKDSLVTAVALSEIRTHRDKAPVQVRGRLRLHISAEAERALPDLRRGDQVRFRGIPRSPSGYETPGAFDMAGWLQQHGITHQLSLKSVQALDVIQHAHPLYPPAIVDGLRNAVTPGLTALFSEGESITEEGALLLAMTLGNRGYINEEDIALLRRAGLMHIIAISGFHVWVLGILIYAALMFLNVPVRYRWIISIAVLLSYWALAGGRAATTRATLIAVIFLLDRLFSRRQFTLNSLAFAACVIAFLDPLGVFGPGYQLTFAAATAIVLFTRPLTDLLDGLGFFSSPLAVGLAAHAGVLPIVAWHFNAVTLHSALSGLLILPIVSAAVFLGIFLVFIAQFVPLLATTTAALLLFLFGIMGELVQLLNAVIPTHIRLPAPPLWLVGLHYAALGVMLFMLAHRRRTSLLPDEERLSLTMLIPPLLTAALIVLNPFAGPQKDQWMVHAIDVGQGSSLLVERPGGGAMLIDAGGTPAGDFDIGEQVVSPFLWHRGHRKLDIVVATHADADHTEGLVSVVTNFQVGELWLPLNAEKTDLLAKLIAAARRQNVTIRQFARSDRALWQETEITVMNPPLKPYRNPGSSNKNSLVLHFQAGPAALLLTGDAERIAMDEAAEIFGENMRADIFVVPHHGSSDALSTKAYHAVEPRLALIQAGKDNLFNFPRPDVLNALIQAGATPMGTHHFGTIGVTILEEALILRTGKQQRIAARLPIH